MSGSRATDAAARLMRHPSVGRMESADPLGTVASRPLTILASAVAFAVAILLTATQAEAIVSPGLMAAAFVALGLSCGLLIYGADVMRSPFSPGIHAAVVVLAWAAALLAALAEWPNNAFARDDWGPYVIAIVLIASSPFRSVRSLGVALVASTIFVGVLAAFQMPHRVAELSPLAFALLTAGPIVVTASGGIAFVRATIAARAKGPTPILPVRGRVEPTEHERRVMILMSEVAPLFSRVVGRGEVSGADMARATEIAESVRASMVDAADRSWLAGAVSDVSERSLSRGIRTAPPAHRTIAQLFGSVLVRDERNLSALMSYEQRVVSRALLEVIFTHQQLIPESFSARVVCDGKYSQLSINASFGPDVDAWEGGRGAVGGHAAARTRSPAAPPVRRRQLRGILTPFLAVARTVFSRVDVTTKSTGSRVKLTLRFSYEL